MELRKLLLIAFAFSGMAALIYELTWIRPLQFIFGSTVYTISIVFAVFMFGLALGSLILSRYVDKIRNLPFIYSLMILGIGLYGVLLLSIFNLLPQAYNKLYFLHTNFYLFQVVQFVLVFVVLLIPTTLMGATFPLIAKFYTREKIGKGIGEVYSANNIGAIFGSFGAGFILIPLLGIKASIITAGSINIALGALVILVADEDNAGKAEIHDKRNRGIIAIISIVLFLVFAYFGDYSIRQMHSGGFYRTDPSVAELGDVAYYKEGLYATVTVRFLKGDPGRVLFINGKGQGGTGIPDLRVNFLLSYLPLLINPEINNTLVIGLGTGTTSGQLAQHKNVTTVEIEPAIVGAAPYFDMLSMNVLENPNHTLIIDDGRNYLLKNKERYDVIIPEPSDPWQAFSTTLFSQEFFRLASNHLNDDGLYIQWAPIYQMSAEDFRGFYNTFSSVFPYTAAFANIKPDEDTPRRFGTSEIILIGSKKEIKINQTEFNENYRKLPEQSKKYLDALRLSSGDEVHHLLLFTGRDMEGYAEDAELITDDRPILEFSTARRALNQYPEEVIGDINGFLAGSKKEADKKSVR